MKPELTGTWPKKDRLKPPPPEPEGGRWVALATDRHEFGKPVRALTFDFDHVLEERPGKKRFIRFMTREMGERWLWENRASLDMKTWRYTICTL